MLLFIFSLQLSFFAFNQAVIKKERLEIPSILPTETIIDHSGFSLVYNERHEQAKWVAYELTSDETVKSFERTNHFISDPLVLTGTASNKDYETSGYDRGHLAPAADMSWSEPSMKASFYFSNISPQEPGFNRGVWKNLEELVRNWAVLNQSIYVVTGPVLKNGLKTIGSNKVSVPEYYYKVILDYTSPDIKAIGFIIPNRTLSLPVETYAVSIDSVETFTGIDFFPLLIDEEEAVIEKVLCVPCWNWKIVKIESSVLDGVPFEAIQQPATEIIPAVEVKTIAVQCTGTTRAGKRCGNKTTNADGRCYQHPY